MKGQLLNVRVKLAAKIKDHVLLEVIVENNAQGIEKILGKKGRESDANKRQEQFWAIFSDHLIDDLLRHRGEDHDHQCPQ
jgi:hypothetical protein